MTGENQIPDIETIKALFKARAADGTVPGVSEEMIERVWQCAGISDAGRRLLREQADTLAEFAVGGAFKIAVAQADAILMGFDIGATIRIVAAVISAVQGVAPTFSSLRILFGDRKSAVINELCMVTREDAKEVEKRLGGATSYEWKRVPQFMAIEVAARLRERLGATVEFI